MLKKNQKRALFNFISSVVPHPAHGWRYELLKYSFSDLFLRFFFSLERNRYFRLVN